MRRSTVPRIHGFTAVEVLAVMAIAGILSALAAPQLNSILGSMRVSASASTWLADLHLARSEAIKRRVRVTLCTSPDGQVCARSGGWQQGWIVFVDTDGNGRRDAGEMILQRQPGLDAHLRMTGTTTVASYVAYAPTGSTRLAGGGFQAGTLTVCDASPAPVAGRQVVINASGRPRLQKVALDSCQ